MWESVKRRTKNRKEKTAYRIATGCKALPVKGHSKQSRLTELGATMVYHQLQSSQ